MHRPCMDGRNYLPGMTATTVASRFYFKLEHFMGSIWNGPRRHSGINAATYLHSTQLGNNVTKDELRAELERQEQRYKDVYGGEITTYAAQPEPERKPWRKRASLLDQAFAQEIQKIEQELKAEEP